MSLYVLDSFAVLAEHWNEPGGARVRQLWNDANNRLWISVVNAGEVYYRIAREEDESIARGMIDRLSSGRLNMVDIDLVLALSAAGIKARFALSYADCFAAALAQRLDARVVTGDPEFEAVEHEGIVQVEWLPRRR